MAELDCLLASGFCDKLMLERRVRQIVDMLAIHCDRHDELSMSFAYVHAMELSHAAFQAMAMQESEQS